MLMWRKTVFFLMGGILFGFLSACDNSKPTGLKEKGVPLAALQLSTLPACDTAEFKTFIKDNLKAYFVNDTLACRIYPMMEKTVSIRGGTEALPSSGMLSSTNLDSGPPSAVSSTNNQELGVEESDLIKAGKDGFTYMLNGNHLIINKSFPVSGMKAAGQTATWEFKKPSTMNNNASIVSPSPSYANLEPVGLYLDEVNKKLIAVMNYYSYGVIPFMGRPINTFAAIWFPYLPDNHTYVYFFDITNPLSPTPTKEMKLDGFYQNSRQIKNRLHLITRHEINPKTKIMEDAVFSDLYQKYTDALRKVDCGTTAATSDTVTQLKNQLIKTIDTWVDAQEVSQFLPKAYVNGAPIADYLHCEDIYRPNLKLNYALQVVSSMDTDGGQLSTTAIVNDGWLNAYASEQNLYLTQYSGGWWWGADQPEETAIYKFILSDGTAANLNTRYVATGKVDGRVVNQFNFGEYLGDLRVATTHTKQWTILPVPLPANDGITVTIAPPPTPPEQENHLFVLRDDLAGKMPVIGAVRNFTDGYGRNETIQSSRFRGKVGIVVTFERKDPLFTFDLSNPTQPKMAGALVIPGFSSYIHFMDETHLITLGRNGGENGIGVSMDFKLDLVDLTDLSKPKVTHQVLGQGWSNAEFDHKAFTFFKNYLAIPVSSWTTVNNVSTYSNAIRVYKVNATTGFNHLTDIDHLDLEKEAQVVSYVQPNRTVFMFDKFDVLSIYSMSNLGLKGVLWSNTVTSNYILFPQPSDVILPLVK